MRVILIVISSSVLVGIISAILLLVDSEPPASVERALLNQQAPVAEHSVQSPSDTISGTQSEGADEAAKFPAGAKTENVLGVEVRKDRNCTVHLNYLEDENGVVREIFSCIPNSAVVAHPYESYDDDALASMSYGDAKAAEILGKRKIETDPKEALRLIVRASALSDGDPKPLLWLADARYSVISINDKIQSGSLSDRYILHSLARELGSEDTNTEFFRQALEGSGATSRRLEELNDRAANVLLAMKRIQTEVNGRTTLGE